ncbi:hypothetical protein PHYBLDRAFT_59422 [Phycomyces blakesleeanus NRRL 1555(-)]|uniref:Uncharacterized protein n=1 Tax=Phycomyces blakesleeanus (strain ATCC 8743b / DSM 1359 / FGSC 10004 / NBRC 33097 / NRRL 1555) TaxID=763407 RepID=A0A162UFQ6_PHYB8|nr:hypothetical protein PHYBLDRAFT_59422 [Phycomyces blakesleeanus NRRL 1555(-)]OAD75892.1 hypothetical protein PHYBLDRAFT_59422 [Phycomyces blakesleeanus NRRL 1555(-)]|eukprot:XP_018293932.1 hypothetical protein PHYBLDRAFT_59422 [Phycomyces blakesleeanus NRRL 1555(-)]
MIHKRIGLQNTVLFTGKDFKLYTPLSFTLASTQLTGLHHIILHNFLVFHPYQLGLSKAPSKPRISSPLRIEKQLKKPPHSESLLSRHQYKKPDRIQSSLSPYKTWLPKPTESLYIPTHFSAKECLASNISSEFGWYSVLMVKNWFVSHNHRYELINGALIRCLLCKHESGLCLFDTLGISKHYLSCSRLYL